MADEKEKTTKRTVGEKEEEILAYWREKKIFEQSLKKNEGKDPYVFYDGPPFATGTPHYGHILAGTIKDVIPRYQTMRGRFVRREWGWDCHGLPIENLIEKELGFQTKRDIEAYGIGEFNQKARDSVMAYDKEWKEVVPRMGRWVDMQHAYKTMDASYTESIWWAFKTLFEKKVKGEHLIYEGYKSMHVCPRCETTLAASEVALGYKDIKDISVYVKFPVVGEPNTAFLAWTTTPWTLPGNVALAVGADIDYVKIGIARDKDKKESFLIMSEYLYRAALAPEHPLYEEIGQFLEYKPGETVRKEGDDAGYVAGRFKGKDLVGRSYTPIFDDYASDKTLKNHENGWKVYAADFVATENGTGIVHIAPAFGEDDMELGKRMKLPFVQHVGMDGKVKPEVKGFAGLFVKPKSDEDRERLATDILVLKYLEEHDFFFAKENITHSYPHCWRCDWPLLNYAASSWFVNVLALKERLIEENREVSWIPENTREGRFGKWLEGARDWAISRSRYWGAPLPVWRCNKCAKIEVMGSLYDLREKTRSKNSYFVMRHGEALTNETNTVSYKVDDPYPLTKKGREQVTKAIPKIKEMNIDLIIASPVLRTKETAEMVRNGVGLPESALIFDARLSEVNTGEFNGRSIEDYRTYFTSTIEKFTKRPPGGETLAEMKRRFGEALYEFDRIYQGKRILIVTHEYGEWMIEAAARGMTNEEAAWLRTEGGDDFIKNAEVRELKFAVIPHNDQFELDYHRPYVDRVSYQCGCGLGTMERVPEVFDCWFESGAMPFAQFHYLGDERTEEGKQFMKNFPADFIAEGVDQTRGWFYTLLILAVGLFDRSPYKSVIMNGIILAEDGQKMSKKLKNYPDPMEVVRKYGADALRFYLMSAPVVRGEDLCFSVSGVDDVYKKITSRLDNVLSFYEMYGAGERFGRVVPDSGNFLDQWILARLHETHAEVTHHLDTHELDKAVRPIPPFIDDLSTWYLRRSRERLKSDDTEEAARAELMLGWTLFQTAKLLAPFMPFMAEDIYRRLPIEEKLESIHLEDWSPMGIGLHAIIEDMAEVRRIVSAALLLRAKGSIKVRQPLALLTVGGKRFIKNDEYIGLIKDEVNVREVKHDEELPEGAIELDTTITPELKEEGMVRDIIRAVQDLRKEAGLIPGEAIALVVGEGDRMREFVMKHQDELKKSASVERVDFTNEADGTKVAAGDAAAMMKVVRLSETA